MVYCTHRNSASASTNNRLKEFSKQLELSHEEAEKLKQEKADLRHRMVRMSYKNKGEEDETLPNLVKRLSLQAREP